MGRRKISMTAMLQALKIVLILFGVGVQCQTEYDNRDGKDMSISEHRQCYVFGQCQEYSIDFSKQENAEDCHSFCGKLEGCNWWSWQPDQSLCLAFQNCTVAGAPSDAICPDCISGEKLCPSRECHQQYKCRGHFVDTLRMSHVRNALLNATPMTCATGTPLKRTMIS